MTIFRSIPNDIVGATIRFILEAEAARLRAARGGAL